jgi:predicted HTH transcriptional regulator
MKKTWSKYDIKALRLLYPKFTTKELMKVTRKSEESINTKIRRMKETGLVKGTRLQETNTRAMRQRNQDMTKKWLSRTWSEPEVDTLRVLYQHMTNKELEMVFSQFTRAQIKNKLSSLMASGKIKKGRRAKTKTRAIAQRIWLRQIRPGVFNVAPNEWMDKE